MGDTEGVWTRTRHDNRVEARDHTYARTREMNGPALRKRGQGGPAGLGSRRIGLGGQGKLGARRLADVTNTVSANPDEGSPGKKFKRRSPRRDDDANADSWNSWSAWTTTAAKTARGVTRLVAEQAPDFTSPPSATTSSASKKPSLSKDIHALKSQGLAAFTSIGEAANTFAQAIESTIDESFKEMSRLVVISPPRGGAAPALSGSGRPSLDGSGRVSSSSSALPGAGAAATKASPAPPSRRAGGLFARELGDIWSGPKEQSPDNVRVLERLHKKAVESTSALESTRQQVLAGQKETSALKSKNVKLENTLRKYQQRYKSLAQEHKSLKTKVETDAAMSSSHSDDAAELVRSQLETLLLEKAKLVKENARLQSENSGLQELLSYAYPAPDPHDQEALGGPDAQAEFDP